MGGAPSTLPARADAPARAVFDHPLVIEQVQHVTDGVLALVVTLDAVGGSDERGLPSVWFAWHGSTVGAAHPGRSVLLKRGWRATRPNSADLARPEASGRTTRGDA